MAEVAVPRQMFADILSRITGYRRSRAIADHGPTSVACAGMSVRGCKSDGLAARIAIDHPNFRNVHQGDNKSPSIDRQSGECRINNQSDLLKKEKRRSHS